MFFLAQCHGDGALGLQVDKDRAFSLYHSAAKLNHPPSAYRTAGRDYRFSTLAPHPLFSVYV